MVHEIKSESKVADEEFAAPAVRLPAGDAVTQLNRLDPDVTAAVEAPDPRIVVVGEQPFAAHPPEQYAILLISGTLRGCYLVGSLLAGLEIRFRLG